MIGTQYIEFGHRLVVVRQWYRLFEVAKVQKLGTNFESNVLICICLVIDILLRHISQKWE